MNFSIIIVNYNTINLLLDCIESIKSTSGDLSAQIIVVDNASSDRSAEIVKEKFPDVELIINNENVGFARANNQAIEQASGEIIILLNSDTIVLPGALHAVKKYINGSGAVIIGTQLLNKDMTIQPSFGKYASLLTEAFFQLFLYHILPSPFPLGKRVHPLQNKQYHETQSVDWLTGACLAFTPSVIQRVGMLDEINFMYGEDMEWCRRAKRAGVPRIYYPEAKIIHLGNRSSRKDYSGWIANYTRASLRFIRSYKSAQAPLAGFLVIVGSVMRLFLWSVIWLARLRSRKEAEQRLSGYRMALQIGASALAMKKV